MEIATSPQAKFSIHNGIRERLASLPMNEPADQPESARGFWALIVTQFQGAFSDNVLKNLVIFMLIGLNVSLAEKHRIGELVGALFSLPFILFSMAGGFLADRFS